MTRALGLAILFGRTKLRDVIFYVDNFLTYRFAVLITVLLIILVGFMALTPLSRLPIRPVGGDFFHHMLAFGSICFFIATVKPKDSFWLMLFCVVYGGLIEIIQPYIYRYGEWSDFIANVIGSGFGIFLGVKFYFFRKRLLI